MLVVGLVCTILYFVMAFAELSSYQRSSAVSSSVWVEVLTIHGMSRLRAYNFSVTQLTVVNSHGFEVRRMLYPISPCVDLLLQYWNNPGPLVSCELRPTIQLLLSANTFVF